MVKYLKYIGSIIAHKYWVAWYLICFIGTLILHKIVYAFNDPLKLLTGEAISKLSLYDISLLHIRNSTRNLALFSYASRQLFSLIFNTKSKVSCIGFSLELLKRAITHDLSKLRLSEAKGFIALPHELKNIRFGTSEYKQTLQKFKPIITLHYKRNTHHPEFYGEKGILGMNLFDFIEMLYDWKAAGKRNKDGNITQSIFIQQAKLNLETMVVSILFNTI
jgi:hypothetical protein